MSTEILEPKVTLSIIPADSLATNRQRRILIIGQKLVGGTAIAGALVEGLNFSDEDALFGQRSHIAGMVRSAKKVMQNIVPQPQIDAISLDDDGGATEATSVITLTGPATEDGTLIVNIGSKNDHSFTVDITSGDTATVIGDALEAAITADGDAPFTAANVAGVVTVTASNGGTLANTWGLSVEGLVAGVTVVLTAWIGGATDPSLTALFDPVQDVRHTTIVWPEAYTITDLTDFLDPRFNASNAILDGMGIQVKSDTLANLKAFVAPLNSQSLNVLANRPISTDTFKASAIFGINDNMAAEIGAIRALRLTPNAPITQFVDAAGAPADAFGGIRISSKPYHNTRLPNIPIALPGDYFTQLEQNELTTNGVSVFGANRVNNGSILGTQVTTYLTDGAGNPDTSFKFLNTVDQMSIIREFYFENFRNNYQSARLTGGAVGGGGKKENVNTIRSFCTELFQVLAGQDVTQDGQGAVTDYEANLVVTLDLLSGTVTINQKPLLVGQLRVIIGTIEVNFG